MKNHKRTPKLICLMLMLAILVSTIAVTAAADDATVPASGYCAVGEVGSDRAAILLPDGTVVQAPFTDTAPVSGTVMSYTVADGIYTFEAVTFGGYTSWRIYDNDDQNGDFYYANDGTNDLYAFIDATATGFVKFSNTSWSVYNGNHMIEIADGVSDYPNTTWTANVDAHWNGDLQKLDVLFADCTVTYTTGPANPSVLFNGTATPDTAGNKDVVLTAEPAPIVTTTYCAVGEVGSDKAAILLSDGTVVQAPFTGTAPVSGTVMSYTVADGIYTFEAVTFGGYTSWRIYDNDDQNGDYYYDGGSTYAFIDAAAAGFVKFSNTSWSVYNGNHMIEIAEGVGDYPNTAWPANVDAHWNGDIQKMDVLFADCTITYTTGPANPSVLFNGTATPDTVGNKDVVLTTTEPDPTDPTEPDPTEPTPEPGPMGNSICAVGEVDTEAGLAAVLFENGTAATVRFVGTAPKSGALHVFRKVGDAFEFAEKEYDPLTAQWRVYDHLADGDGDNTDFVVNYDAAGNETRYYFSKDCVAFVKFSDTSWSLVKGGQMINIKEQVQEYPYTVWPFGILFSTETLGTDTCVDSLFCDATSSKAATALLTADQKEMTAGAYDLHVDSDNVTSPDTGDNMNLTAVVIAMLLSAAAVVALIRKKEA